MRWLGLILGAGLLAAAIFYLIVGLLPASGISQRMRARLELAADIGRAKGSTVNSAALYAWMLRTRVRAVLVAIFLLFWAVVFLSAAFRT